jgi:uncharacterized protein YdaU (DUF1376 family)
MKPPAFQFYADDFVAGVADMTQSEVGAYILLLCHQWSRGEIPSDKARASMIAKGEISEHVSGKFPAGKNARLEQEREKQSAYREMQSQKGQASAKARFNRGSTAVQFRLEPKVNSPSPSPLVEREREASLPEIPPMPRKDFDSLCQMRGIPTECAEWFWNTHDARNWTDATGQIIRKVEPVLLNAFKNWRAKASQTQSGSKPSQSVYSITKVIEAKKEQADGLKARWAVETGLDTTWSSEKAKADYRELKKEIKELNQKLSGMA